MFWLSTLSLCKTSICEEGGACLELRLGSYQLASVQPKHHTSASILSAPPQALHMQAVSTTEGKIMSQTEMVGMFVCCMFNTLSDDAGK